MYLIRNNDTLLVTMLNSGVNFHFEEACIEINCGTVNNFSFYLLTLDALTARGFNSFRSNLLPTFSLFSRHKIKYAHIYSLSRCVFFRTRSVVRNSSDNNSLTRFLKSAVFKNWQT